jgi:hypothetical protein
MIGERVRLIVSGPELPLWGSIGVIINIEDGDFVVEFPECICVLAPHEVEFL